MQLGTRPLATKRSTISIARSFASCSVSNVFTCVILVCYFFLYIFFLELKGRRITILSAIRKITQENIICSFLGFSSD